MFQCYAEVCRNIAIIGRCSQLINFTGIEWLPCVNFSALLMLQWRNLEFVDLCCF